MRSNKGFSLIELIIMIAILSVLIGTLSPKYLKYVERSKRVTDVTNARLIRDAAERVQALDALGTGNGAYKYTGAVMWNKDTPYPTKIKDFSDAIFIELGQVPVSAVNKDLFWCMYYNQGNGSIKKIVLTTRPGSSVEYELYPDPSKFLENGIN